VKAGIAFTCGGGWLNVSYIIIYYMEKVIPQGLNYADIKPELIENRVKLVQFRPHSSATNASPGQTIRFDIKSNGFYDPYSAYFKFVVSIPTEALE